MPLPAIGMLGRGGLELLKYIGVIAPPAITLGFFGQPKEYERNFDYDYYEKDHPRFYSPIWASEDNPEGFNEEMYIEAMDEFHRTQPMY